MQFRSCFSFGGGVAFLVCVLPAATAAPRIDLTLAAQYFQEARALSEKDRGELWGVPLGGPMMFVEPVSRSIIANQSDDENQLTRQGEVFVGRLPQSQNIANTAVHWAGVHWTMIPWPLPRDKHDRAALMMHESWHRIQDKIGFPGCSPANTHLDTPRGRLWLQLEWRALAAALRGSATERNQAIHDALLFRSERRRLFKEASGDERSLEMHEGLAEYTGFRLCGLSGQQLSDYTAKALETRPRSIGSFVRSFAYLSGPGYGILLDETGVPWRKGLKPSDDLGVLLAKAGHLDIPPSSQQQAEERMKQYEGEALRIAEVERDKTRQKRTADYRARLVDGPVLVIPLHKMQFSFDPTNVQPLPDVGTVYPSLRISDDWGVLTATGDALMSSDFRRVHVKAPDKVTERPIKGDGWQLDLKDGFEIQPGKRGGDYTVVPRKK
jgi:hypothetical protein